MTQNGTFLKAITSFHSLICTPSICESLKSWSQSRKLHCSNHWPNAMFYSWFPQRNLQHFTLTKGRSFMDSVPQENCYYSFCLDHSKTWTWFLQKTMLQSVYKLLTENSISGNRIITLYFGLFLVWCLLLPNKNIW